MSRRWLAVAALAVSAVAVACGGAADGISGSDGGAQATATPEPAATAQATPGGTRSATAEATAAPATDPRLIEEQLLRIEALDRLYPSTDFTKRTVGLDEIIPVLPPDTIPSIRRPDFIDFAEAGEWLGDQEPVISVEIDGDARAYPLQIMVWHEIVIDTVGDVPVIVTFCPLCNTALTFDRRVNGEPRTFTTSGSLRRNDLIMIDLEKSNLWQQITGEAIVGEDAGTKLRFIASQIVSYQAFKETFPQGQVLSRTTGFFRSYGSNPYPGYDTIGSSTLFPIDEFDDDRLDLKERVLTVEIGGEAIAFPFSELTENVVLEAEVGGELVVAFWQPGTLSALDEVFIVGSANVGSASAYSPFVDGERLTFEARDGQIVDTKTGSTWNVLGLATAGPLEGTSLEPVISANHFWFAWSVFQPDTRVIRGED